MESIKHSSGFDSSRHH